MSDASSIQMQPDQFHHGVIRKHWIELFAPSLLYRRKWHEGQRELKVEDVVLVLQDATFKEKFKLRFVLARMDECEKYLLYKNYRTGEEADVYKGTGYTAVYRSCQKLVLLVLLKNSK